MKCRLIKLISFLYLIIENLSLKKSMFNTSKSELKKIANKLMDSKSFKVKKEMHINDEFIREKDDKITAGSVLYNPDTKELTYIDSFLDKSPNNQKRLIAVGRYSKTLATIGWSKLYIETFNNCPSEIQSYAAGYIEGKLTAKNILEFYQNLVGIHSDEKNELDEVFKYYEKVESHIRKRTSKQELDKLEENSEIEYWITVAMVQAQTDGLYAGYHSVMKNIDPLSFAKFYFINADGEVPELISVFKARKEENTRLENSSIDTKFSFRQKYYEKFSKEYLLKNFGFRDPELVWQSLMSRSHCSALIKCVSDSQGNLKDIMIGHTTWDSYSEMHRIFKIYDFKFTLFRYKESLVMFSSYPGTLTSTDDFYMLNSKIAVLETTLEILDRDLYVKNVPEANGHVPNYIRISVANRLAASGKQWTEIFKLNNSGTYNSQWMIIDYQKLGRESEKPHNSRSNIIRHKGNKAREEPLFKPIQNQISDYTEFISSNENSDQDSTQQAPNSIFSMNFNFSFKSKDFSSIKELFFVLEQIPGTIIIKDMTEHLLSKSFWASYNRPFFREIYMKSGYYEMMKRYGQIYSYENNPRASIIHSRIKDINSIEELKSLMQSNKNSFGQLSINSISPRFDLDSNPNIRKPSGGIDTKITSMQMIRSNEVVAISGPSSRASNTVPFKWSDFKTEPHFGLPEFWDFDWVRLDLDKIRTG